MLVRRLHCDGLVLPAEGDLFPIATAIEVHLNAVASHRLQSKDASQAILDSLFEHRCGIAPKDRVTVIATVERFLDYWNLQCCPDLAQWNEMTTPPAPLERTHGIRDPELRRWRDGRACE